MYLYVIRHGQKTFSSRPADAPDWELTDLGQRQAEYLAEVFRNIHLDTLISSPLLRALQTATPLARMTGQNIHVWRDLVESYAGDKYIGPASATLRKTYPVDTIDPEEPDGLQSALKEAANATDISQRATAARRRAEQFDWESIGTQIARIYREVVPSHFKETTKQRGA